MKLDHSSVFRFINIQKITFKITEINVEICFLIITELRKY